MMPRSGPGMRLPKESLAETSHRSDEPLRVFGWRVECLMNAGYDLEAAWLIGDRVDVDLHQACSLLIAGCAISTALLILL